MINNLLIIAEAETVINLLDRSTWGNNDFSKSSGQLFGMRLLLELSSSPATISGESRSNGRTSWPNSCQGGRSFHTGKDHLYLLQGLQDLGTRYTSKGVYRKEVEAEETVLVAAASEATTISTAVSGATNSTITGATIQQITQTSTCKLMNNSLMEQFWQNLEHCRKMYLRWKLMIL